MATNHFDIIYSFLHMPCWTWPQIIDKIIEFARFQIVHSVFTAFDSGYRQIHKGGIEGNTYCIGESILLRYFEYLVFQLDPQMHNFCGILFGNLV